MRKVLLWITTTIATCLFLGSCTELHETAQNVQYSTKSEAPKDCKQIGEVAVGSIIPLFDMTSVKNAMRNKTAQMGGNFLVIDDIKTVSSPAVSPGGYNGFGSSGGYTSSGSTSGYAGSGRAYQCPQAQ